MPCWFPSDEAPPTNPGAYPERPVTLVVPWAAGGSTDAVAHILAARLSRDTGRSFVIDNRAGANGTIVARVDELARTAMAAPETRERLAALAVTPETQRPEDWAAYNAAENRKWGEVIRSCGIKVQ